MNLNTVNTYSFSKQKPRAWQIKTRTPALTFTQE